MYVFHTSTEIPIESFTTFGVHAKPNTDNPLGHFGTGLKYAVAIILRKGGTIRLVVAGVEYEFYTAKSDFRGKQIEKIRMRKRKGLNPWRSIELAFTTELGKNWDLWQAYRELESNTRDENGTSGLEGLQHPKSGTTIEVTCTGFDDTAQLVNEVFLDEKGPLVFDNRVLSIYDSPSKYIYYRGVRVHEMQYPARMTYDFKKYHVTLSEDRSAMNVYDLFSKISVVMVQDIQDPKILYKALNKSDRKDENTFEGHDLSFNSYYTPSNVFREVARKMTMRGYAPSSIRGVHHNYSYAQRASEESKYKMEMTLTTKEWHVVAIAMEGTEIGDKIRTALEDHAA